jgi:hypothetical protein
VPGLPNSAKSLNSDRDDLLSRNPSDPAIPLPNDQITEAVLASKCQLWKEKVESSCFKNNPGKCWFLYKLLFGKKSLPPPNQPIAFNGKVVTKGLDIARKFCKQFMKTVPHKTNYQSRIVIRNLIAKHKLDSFFSLSLTWLPETPLMLLRAFLLLVGMA